VSKRELELLEERVVKLENQRKEMPESERS